MVTFSEPRVTTEFPTEPCLDFVNKYVLWLTVYGIANAHAIARKPDQAVTMAQAIRLVYKLNREFVTSSRETVLGVLENLQNFFALMLRYPLVPKLAMDSKICPECMFESEITLDTWEDVKKNIACFHFTVRHEAFRHAAEISDDQTYQFKTGHEMVRAEPSEIARAAEDGRDKCGRLAAKFTDQLRLLKIRDEIVKQRTLTKDMYNRMKCHLHTLTELKAPRYLNTYPLRYLCQSYGSLNRSKLRSRKLAQRHPGLSDDIAAALLTVAELRRGLACAAPTSSSNRLILYICDALVTPARRYSSRYTSLAQRVVLFKHLVASGFSTETAWNLIKSILRCDLTSMILLSHNDAVTLQLKNISEPSSYNRKVASLIWLFSHITAYCVLRQLHHDYVRMGDSPRPLDLDGIYVFDQDHVGFMCSRAGSESRAACCYYVPFERVLELLAVRDRVQERLRR